MCSRLQPLIPLIKIKKKNVDKLKQVKINAGKIERRFGVVMTPFSSSKMIQINCQECLENGVMTTPKRRSILPALIFTCF